MFRCNFDVMESLEFLWDLNTPRIARMGTAPIGSRFACAYRTTCSCSWSSISTLKHGNKSYSFSGDLLDLNLQLQAVS